ncbi:uncharacterized protein F5147DRAFT_652368 [Suillus discolor]|uniref:Uncharacterized protein n=1 Tax=Suillus discolor TaxID=1912936 RepID=A0A9P7JUK3_9AGAM|nr:uncharacterized protein F5147DRAFT_652368 [Suillus discolor]KAG2109268.1 hypothetical protein F5147DRAFT_652368 [Suillus discolor]
MQLGLRMLRLKTMFAILTVDDELLNCLVKTVPSLAWVKLYSGTDEKSVVNNTAKKDHFHEQLEDGPADCYLAALCLDPRYVRSAILHNPLSLKIKIPCIPSIAVPNILTSPTYVQVLKYLKIVIEAEFKSQHNPAVGIHFWLGLQRLFLP